MKSDSMVDVITLTGELDIARKDELRQTLTAARAARKVLIDLADVTYADSTALSELLRFTIDVEGTGVSVAVLAVAPQFLRIIEYAGLTRALHVFTDRDDALSYLQSER